MLGLVVAPLFMMAQGNDSKRTTPTTGSTNERVIGGGAQSAEDSKRDLTVSPDDTRQISANGPTEPVQRDTIYVPANDRGRFQVDLSGYVGKPRPVIIIQVEDDAAIIKKEEE